MASARALRLPSVASRVFRTEVGMGFQKVPERKVYRNDSEYEYEDERSGDSEYVWFGGARNARGRFLACRKSQVERDKNQVEFDIQNAETYMTRGS